MQCIYSGVKFYSVPGFDTNYYCTAILYLNQKRDRGVPHTITANTIQNRHP